VIFLIVVPHYSCVAGDIGELQRSLLAKRRGFAGSWSLLIEATLGDRFATYFDRAASASGSCGIYIYGGVGVGKSLLMDLFFSSLPTTRKRRSHYHAFMVDVHRRSHIIRCQVG
jgi:predicted ATPase